MKHTPGPWRPHIGHNGHISTTDGYAVADCCLDYSSIEHMEQLANAILVASAPDLLAALKAAISEAKPLSIRRELRPGDGCTSLVEITEWADWIDDARAAIQKATGESA